MSNSPIISVIHPTARVKGGGSFPKGWRGACDQFFATCAHPENVEYILVVHESRWEAFWQEVKLIGEWAQDADGVWDRSGLFQPNYSPVQLDLMRFGWNLVIKNRGRDCVVDQINAGAAASSGKLLIGIMDDLEAPQHWDVGLLLSLWPDHPTTEVIAPELDREAVIDLTGEPTEHIVYGALARARYEKQGFILHPEFESMFADNYFSHQAHKDGVVINGRHLGFRHNHPTNGRSEMDEVYALQNRQEAYTKGRATFARLAFGTRVVAHLLPGESFRYEVAGSHAQLQQFLTEDNRFMAVQLRAHCTNVYVTRILLAQQALDLPMFPDLVAWQDDDNPFYPHHFQMLVADLDADPTIDIVVGCCWCDNDGELGPDGKPKPWMISAGRQRPNLDCLRFTQEDLQRLAETGQHLITSDDLAPDAFWSGFPVVLMRGSALRKLGWEAFKPMLIPEVKYGFTSEDTSFFINAHRAGLKCALDTRVFVEHKKFHSIEPPEFALARRQALAPVEQPEAPGALVGVP